MKSIITQSFVDLGLTPRPEQLEACNQILELFNNGITNVIVDAPTGSGKSVIGLVIHTALKKLAHIDKSVIMTATNQLVKQYTDDFERYGTIKQVIGANRYECQLRQELFNIPASAELCYRKSKFYYDRDVDAMSETCSQCKFAMSRRDKINAPVVITNYAYFMIDRLFISRKTDDPSMTFDNRELYIFDEAHLINEQFSAHGSVFFSKARMDEYIRDCDHLFQDGGPSTTYRSALGIVIENIGSSTIAESNCQKFLNILMNFYNFMHERAGARRSWAKHEATYDHLWALERKYHGLFCKIDDIIKYGIDVSVQCNPRDLELTIKPIFPLGIFPSYLAGKYNLFMSATVAKDFLVDTLQLNNVEMVKVPYSFNHDDKTVIIPERTGTVKLNFESLRDTDTIDETCRICSDIARVHKNHSGIIVTTSFYLTKAIANKLQTTHDIIVHDRGMSLGLIIADFKRTEKPTILISPMLFEGVDLPGNYSRFQIIVKAPYLRDE